MEPKRSDFLKDSDQQSVEEIMYGEAAQAWMEKPNHVQPANLDEIQEIDFGSENPLVKTETARAPASEGSDDFIDFAPEKADSIWQSWTSPAETVSNPAPPERSKPGFGVKDKSTGRGDATDGANPAVEVQGKPAPDSQQQQQVLERAQFKRDYEDSWKRETEEIGLRHKRERDELILQQSREREAMLKRQREELDRATPENRGHLSQIHRAERDAVDERQKKDRRELGEEHEKELRQLVERQREERFGVKQLLDHQNKEISKLMQSQKAESKELSYHQERERDRLAEQQRLELSQTPRSERAALLDKQRQEQIDLKRHQEAERKKLTDSQAAERSELFAHQRAERDNFKNPPGEININDLKQRIADLEKENSTLVGQLDQFKTENAALKQKVEQLQQEIKKREEELAERDKTIADRDESIADRDKTIAELQERTKELEEQNQKLRDLVQQLLNKDVSKVETDTKGVVRVDINGLGSFERNRNGYYRLVDTNGDQLGVFQNVTRDKDGRIWVTLNTQVSEPIPLSDVVDYFKGKKDNQVINWPSLDIWFQVHAAIHRQSKG